MTTGLAAPGSNDSVGRVVYGACNHAMQVTRHAGKLARECTNPATFQPLDCCTRFV